jgi:hypothetical protein
VTCSAIAAGRAPSTTQMICGDTAAPATNTAPSGPWAATGEVCADPNAPAIGTLAPIVRAPVGPGTNNPAGTDADAEAGGLLAAEAAGDAGIGGEEDPAVDPADPSDGATADAPALPADDTGPDAAGPIEDAAALTPPRAELAVPAVPLPELLPLHAASSTSTDATTRTAGTRRADRRLARGEGGEVGTSDSRVAPRVRVDPGDPRTRAATNGSKGVRRAEGPESANRHSSGPLRLGHEVR